VNRQGAIDKKSVDSVDETIDSKGNIAKTRAGGQCPRREPAMEYQHADYRSIAIQIRESEAPKRKLSRYTVRPST
jgi:hypothetical protein